MCFSSFRRVESGYIIFLYLGRKHRKKKVFIFLRWCWFLLLTRTYFLLWDSWIFFDFFMAHLNSFLVHMGFLRTSVIPPGGWIVTGQCFGGTIQGIPCGCQTLCASSVHHLYWCRQSRSEARTATMMKRMWSFVEFSNNGRVYQSDKELLWWAGVRKVSLEGKEMGWNWVSPLVLFHEMRGRNIAGNRSSSHCSRGWFDRDFL